MDQMLLTFVSWQFLIFCLAITAIMEVIKNFVEYFEKDVDDLNLWRKLIYLVLPIFLGAGLGAAIAAYPYPEGISAIAARTIFGLAAGLLSTLVYQAIKLIFKARISFGNSSETDQGQAVDNTVIEAVRETIKPFTDSNDSNNP